MLRSEVDFLASKLTSSKWLEAVGSSGWRPWRLEAPAQPTDQLRSPSPAATTASECIPESHWQISPRCGPSRDEILSRVSLRRHARHMVFTFHSFLLGSPRPSHPSFCSPGPHSTILKDESRTPLCRLPGLIWKAQPGAWVFPCPLRPSPFI